MAFDPAKYLRDGRYDVGKIVRDVTAWYVKVDPNRWTRVEVGQLLLRLSQITDAVAEAGGQMPAQWQGDLDKWQHRLAEYKSIVANAPKGHSTALWQGTAMPLLFGYYGNEEQQRTADVATPFSLANQLEVDREWRKERLRLLGEELTEAAKVAGYGIGAVLAAVLGGAAAVWFLKGGE